MIAALLLTLQHTLPPPTLMAESAATAPSAKAVAVLPFEVAQAVNISARQTLSATDKRDLAAHYFDVARQPPEHRVVGMRGIRVVERSRLDAVLAELNLSKTGLIRADTAAQVGRALGARYILLGSFLDIVLSEGHGDIGGSPIQTTRVTSTVRVRLVETERAEVVGSWSASGDHTELQGFTREVLLDWAVPVITDALDRMQGDGSFERELTE